MSDIHLAGISKIYGKNGLRVLPLLAQGMSSREVLAATG